MNIFTLSEKLAPKMKWYDFSLLKLSVMFATFTIIALWPDLVVWILSVDWYWFALLSIACSVPLFKKMIS